MTAFSIVPQLSKVEAEVLRFQREIERARQELSIRDEWRRRKSSKLSGSVCRSAILYFLTFATSANHKQLRQSHDNDKMAKQSYLKLEKIIFHSLAKE